MIDRYTRPEMAALWTKQKMFETWLEVELNATDAWVKLGKVPAEAAAEMRFEDAGRYKKRLDLLAGYQSKSVVVSNTLGSMDVFSLIIDDGVAFCNFMRIVQGAVVNSFTVELKPGLEDEPRDVLSYAVGSIRDRLQGHLQREVLVPFLQADRDQGPGAACYAGYGCAPKRAAPERTAAPYRVFR